MAKSISPKAILNPLLEPHTGMKGLDVMLTRKAKAKIGPRRFTEAHAYLRRRTQVCRRKRYDPPSPADCYSWPSIARGCNTVVVSHNADQPLSYLLPLLTHILLNSLNISHTSRAGVSAGTPQPRFTQDCRVVDRDVFLRRLFVLECGALIFGCVPPVLTCLCAAHCRAAVSQLAEGPVGL